MVAVKIAISHQQGYNIKNEAGNGKGRLFVLFFPTIVA